MMLAVYGIFLVIVIWLALFRRKSPNLEHIPGPKQSTWARIFGSPNGARTDPRKRHMLYADMNRKYGPIFRVTDGVRNYVVISDYESIHQVLVTQGKQFGGRLANYKIKEVLKNTGVLFNYEPSDTWITLRKISHKHLRQFGDGLSRLENVIGEVADDMFDAFKRNEGLPFDPQQTIYDAALNTIAYLITGERTHAGDALVEDMREYELLFIATFPVFGPLSFKLLNRFHFLKYLGFDRWEPYQRFVRLHHNMWETVKAMNKANPESESICKVLSQHIAKAESGMDEDDAKSTAATLLLAGVTTTSSTFHGVVNILAHHPQVQHNIYQEVQKVSQCGGSPKLSDRPNMPYARAVHYTCYRI